MLSSRVLLGRPDHVPHRLNNALMSVPRAAAAALMLSMLSGNLYAYPVRYDFSGWVEGVDISPQDGERPFEGSLTGFVIFQGGPAVVRLPPQDENSWPQFQVQSSQTITLGGHTWTSANVTGQYCTVYLAIQHQEVQFGCNLDLGNGWRLRSDLWLHDPHLLPDDSRIPEGPFVAGDDSGGKIIQFVIVNEQSGEGIFSRGGARLERISYVDEPASPWLLFPLVAGCFIHRPTNKRLPGA